MATILVVDDELGIRALLSEILTDEGHTVEVAEDASQARVLREQLKPDLVLLDIWMPDVDGITLLKEWGSAGHLSMPVIMMSGHGTIDTAVEAMKFGASAFLEKPVTLQKLLRAVEDGLSRGAELRLVQAGTPSGQSRAGAAGGLQGVSAGGSTGGLGAGAVASAGPGGAGGFGGPGGALVGVSGGGLVGGGFVGGYAAGAAHVGLQASPGGQGAGLRGESGHAGSAGFASSGGGAGMADGPGPAGAMHNPMMGTPSAAGLRDEAGAGFVNLSASQQVFELDRPLREARDAFEKSYFEYHLSRENGSMTRVAEKTGLERTHLYRKLKHLGVDLSRTKRSAG